MCEVYDLDPTYRKLVADQYLVFYHVNENVKVVEIRVLRGLGGICRSTWNKTKSRALQPAGQTLCSF